VAAGPSGTGKTTLLTALLELLPPAADVRAVLGPDPDLAWLPEAGDLGWRRGAADMSGGSAGGSGGNAGGPGVLGPGERTGEPTLAAAPLADRPDHPSRTVLLVPELSAHLPWYAWGDLARVLVRAASIGYGLATTIHAESLEEVFAALQAPPVSLTGDELGHLGVVVVIRAVEPAAGERRPRRRVVAAHLVRPPSRDAHAHVQRLGPAVLAAWDPRRDTLDHYAWGVIPEIALRLGRRAGDVERAQARRAGLLRVLVAGGRVSPEALAAAVEAYRAEHQGDPAA
jgi:energy-coupling factor transporter ATP-binding protein EcfA2